MKNYQYLQKSKYITGFTPHLFVWRRGRVYSSSKKGEGFTLIELLVVVGIIGLLVLIATPTYSQMQKGVAIKQYSYEAVNALRNAQHKSIIAQDGTAHGVHFNADGFVLFGGSWAAPTYTFTQTFGGGIEVTQGAGTEITFDKLTGDAVNAEIKIGISSSQEKSISISEFGRVVLQ